MFQRLRSAWLSYQRGIRLHTLKAKREKLALLRQQDREFRQGAFEGRRDILIQQIGLLTMGWQQLELALDACVRLIHHNGGADAIQRDLPVSLKVKIPYLRKAMRRIPALVPCAAEANAIADEVQRIKHTRHDCIHGWPVIDPDKFDVVFLRIVFEKADLSVAETRYSQLKLGDDTTAALLLFRRGILLFDALANALRDKQAIEVGRQLAIRLSAIPVPNGD